MANITCLECQAIFPDEAALHKHLRSHKITQVVYYQKYYPRYDKLDGNLILFKNRDYYLTADFNSRENMISWMKQVGEAEAKAYIHAWFANRKEKKGLIFAPSQVELRSLCIPAINYINKLYGDYNKFCKDLGLKIRYKTLKWEPKYKTFTPNNSVLVDTREQLPLDFSIYRFDQALPFADYRLNDDAFTHDLYIERKSLADFYATMSSGIERFGRELDRALDAKANMVVLIESPFDSVYGYIHTRQVKGKIHISPEYVFHNMRNLMQKYPNLQFLFVNDRTEAVEVIEKLFRCDGYFKDIDLQYAYDTRQLCGSSLQNI